MSINSDTVIFNTRERAEDFDQNNQSSLLARTHAEAHKYLTSVMPVIGSTRIRQQVIGMNPFASGATFTVGDGVLLTTNPTSGAESPSAFESDYRIGITTGETIPIPAHGGNDRYVLVEGRVDRTVTSENRDILDPLVDDSFASASVPKRETYGVEAQVNDAGVAGVTIPEPTAGWVPLFAYFLEAGVPTITNLIDLRSTSQDFVGETTSGTNLHNTAISVFSKEMEIGFVGGGLTGSEGFVRVSANVNGFMANFRSASNVHADLDPLLSPSDVMTAGTWYFLYLGPAFPGNANSTPTSTGYRAGNAYNRLGFDGNCVAVISSTRPTATGASSATITLGEPFSGRTMANGQLACVGALYRRTAGAWAYQKTATDGTATFQPLADAEANLTTGFPAAPAGTSDVFDIDVDGAGLLGISPMAQHLMIQAVVDTADGAATGEAEFVPVGDGTGNHRGASAWLSPAVVNRPAAPIIVPVRQNETEASLAIQGRTSIGGLGTLNTIAANGAARFTLRLVGFKI